MSRVKIAVIGGSGLYDIPGMAVLGVESIDTPFGKPSDDIRVLDINGTPVAFLPRHGSGHSVNPTHVNARANIFALKCMGVESIISVSAVGSLQEEIAPRSFVIPDQIIDRTKSRINTFFDPYAVHVGFAYPFCNDLGSILYKTSVDQGLTVHNGGIYVCMEGPLFSTRAESALYRNWGASVIGMTALPEAKLAREAEICYATIALVTDYDVWKEDEIVTIDTVLSNIRANVQKVKDLIVGAISNIKEVRSCACRNALENAMITDYSLISDSHKRDWKPLLEKYFK